MDSCNGHFTLAEDIEQVMEEESKVHIVDNRGKLNEVIEDIWEERQSKFRDGAFIVSYIDDVIEKYMLFREKLPQVEPYYAIKANNQHWLARLVYNLGAGFDCGSLSEIRQVQGYGADKEDIVFASTIKNISHIRYCKENDLPYMTFDNEEELFKMRDHYPSCRPILRLKVDDWGSRVRLSSKFGAYKEDAWRLLKTAADCNLDVAGISFHVGSTCMHSELFEKAMREAKDALLDARRLGHDATIIDIGGGFSGKSFHMDQFIKNAAMINTLIENEFQDVPDVRFIAEPGTFFCEGSQTLICQVIGKKKDQYSDAMVYYINEGSHGMFSELKFGNASENVDLRFMRKDLTDETKRYRSVMWGPTCDSFDILYESDLLPELEIGDALIFDHMGAYWWTMASDNFGGFERPDLYFAISKKHKALLFAGRKMNRLKNGSL